MQTLKLLSKNQLIGDIYQFVFTKPQGSWRAGNHSVFFVRLDNGSTDSRPLTIASTPQDNELMVVTHCPEESTPFKAALRTLNVGDEVEMTEPGGEFVLDDEIENPLIVAAGIGISAVRAIVMDRLQRGESLQMEIRYYAHAGMFVFREELEQIAREHPECVVHFYEHDVAELGQIKEVEERDNRKVLMSGVYVQRTDTESMFDPKEDHAAAREEVHLIQAVKKITGG